MESRHTTELGGKKKIIIFTNMKSIKTVSLLIIAFLSSCGFEDNLPCRGSECEADRPEAERPGSGNEG